MNILYKGAGRFEYDTGKSNDTVCLPPSANIVSPDLMDRLILLADGKGGRLTRDDVVAEFDFLKCELARKLAPYARHMRMAGVKTMRVRVNETVTDPKWLDELAASISYAVKTAADGFRLHLAYDHFAGELILTNQAA